MNNLAKQYSSLISGCKAGQRSAQESLYKHFYGDMLRVCVRYLKTDELALEALNSGFLKVFQHINSFDEDKGDLLTWIKTIIVRTCIDIGRKEARFQQDASVGEDTDIIFVAPEILGKLYAEDMLKAIRMLPAATQMVFNLSVIEGFTHTEISDQLNISEGTSRWHLSEAKKQLRVLLNERYGYLNTTDKQSKQR